MCKNILKNFYSYVSGQQNTKLVVIGGDISQVTFIFIY